MGTGLNAGPGQVAISVPATYTSGGAIPITVTVSDPNQLRWGFELSARTQGGQQAGILIPGPDGFTQIVSAGGIQYIEQTLAGSRGGTSGSASFNFQWQAPDISAGPVVFNVAANAANNNFSNIGDRIYATSVTVQPEDSGGPTPSINDGGVVNNASFAPNPAPVALGSIAAIFGTGLNDGSTVLNSSFGPDGKLVDELAQAKVTINGVRSPLFYSTPTQLGVQIPFELAGATSTTVEVTVRGQTSPSRTLFLDRVSPGIFAVNQQGTGQGAVLIANTDVIAAPAGSIPGRTTRSARIGEFISIFATGLGVVSPPLATGVPATGNNRTVDTPTVTIDGLPVTVDFSGGSPGFVGLYQVNVQIPAGTRSGNDISIFLTIGGKQSNTVTIAVGQ